MYAVGKSAEAHEFYWACLEDACTRAGQDFIWLESVECIVMDFHLGQALGLLRHLITKFGNEEGPVVFLKLVRGTRMRMLGMLPWHGVI